MIEVSEILSEYRPDWDDYFMAMTKMVAVRSTCNSRKTGALLVKDRRVIASGYNGALAGMPHCSDVSNQYCRRRQLEVSNAQKYYFCVSNHAEANAIAQAARFGHSVLGATLYCTLAPCLICFKLLVAAGINRILYEASYDESYPYWEREDLTRYGISEFRQHRISFFTMSKIEEVLKRETSRRMLEPFDGKNALC